MIVCQSRRRRQSKREGRRQDRQAPDDQDPAVAARHGEQARQLGREQAPLPAQHLERGAGLGLLQRDQAVAGRVALGDAVIACGKPLYTDQDIPVVLTIANALWGQEGYRFLEGFLALTDEHYGAGLRRVDFRGASEAARDTINLWVEEQTRKTFDDLVDRGQKLEKNENIRKPYDHDHERSIG